MQLGAFSTERDATAHWDKLRAAHPELLNGMEPQYTQALVRGQTFWRLRVGTFAGGPEARSFCEPLRASRVGLHRGVLNGLVSWVRSFNLAFQPDYLGNILV